MKPSTMRVLDLLRQAGDDGVSTATFAREFCPRASARICELRKAGFVVTAERVRDNAYVFRLHSEPSGHGAGPPVGSVSSGNQRAFDPDQDPPAPPASDRALPPADAGQLFEMPIPDEFTDGDRWRDPDQRDAA